MQAWALLLSFTAHFFGFQALGKNVQTIPLQKQYVPVMKGEKTIAYKTAYFGKVWVGQEQPKPFTVVFDTGSGHFILPSTACDSETCMKHERYNRTASSSAVDIEYDGTLIRPGALERDQVAIAFGTGEVLGEFVREVVCLDNRQTSCVTLRVVLASKMTSDPFSFFAFDGVMGLGLDALALDPHFSFFGQMANQHPQMEPRFSVFLSRSGENNLLTFGGHEERLAEGPISWATVAMASLGYWQVQVKSVRIGNFSLPECEDGSCRAIVDTGTSLLGVPKQAARALHRSLARPVPEELQVQEGQSDIDCRRLPGLSIDFEVGDTTISLLPEDYSRPVPFNMTVPNTNKSRLFCRSLLLPVDMAEPLGPKVFIWGEPVLKRYYTVYDLAEKRVGFSLAKQSEQPAGSALPVVGAPPAGSLLSGAPLSSLPPAQVTV